MKRVLVFFILIILLSAPAKHQQGSATQHGISLKDYHSITFYTNSATIPNYNMLEELILLPENPFNEMEAVKMVERVGYIHPNLLEQLIQENIKIKFFNGKLTDEPSAGHLKGIKPRGYSENGPFWDDVPGLGGSQLVLAKIGHSHKGEGHGSINLELHELAHTIDQFLFDSIRYDTYFLDIWKEDVEKLFPGMNYFINYPEEYFAEAFVYFYLSEETRLVLADKAPSTYQLFKSLETYRFSE